MEQQLRETLAEYCRRMYRRGFLPGIDGNVSVRLNDEQVLLTPTGISKENAAPESLVRMSLSGENLSPGQCPSSEAPMHLAAYKRLPDVNAVVHAHSPNATAFALARKTIDTRHAPFAFFHLGIVGYVDYCTPGTPAFHESVDAAFAGGHRVVLLGGHGMLAAGRSLQHAYELTDLLETFADILLKAQMLGGAQMLSNEELALITGG